ncbi:OLC1v1005146C1 [Oldenlandia corymbosa var. corymbosa]|uniref:OLC1v1005146C1 n=1 Tax=Oldenlandia corymbosa var. corymbosa TaxID=529605 RepID=A0AAV1DEJ1_OLDCO|nr:OLC1v1005146C1 [Oldenlandia corymbosa var. corymbosa]
MVHHPRIRVTSMQISPAAESLLAENQSLSLLGYLIDDRYFNGEQMQTYLHRNWAVYARVTHYDRNLFVIRFLSKTDLLASFDNGPYAVHGGLLILRRWYEDDDIVLGQVRITKLSIWVRRCGRLGHPNHICSIVLDVALEAFLDDHFKAQAARNNAPIYWNELRKMFPETMRADGHKNRRCTRLMATFLNKTRGYYSLIEEDKIRDGFRITMAEDQGFQPMNIDPPPEDDDEGNDDSGQGLNGGGQEDIDLGDREDNEMHDDPLNEGIQPPFENGFHQGPENSTPSSTGERVVQSQITTIAIHLDKGNIGPVRQKTLQARIKKLKKTGVSFQVKKKNLMQLKQQFQQQHRNQALPGDETGSNVNRQLQQSSRRTLERLSRWKRLVKPGGTRKNQGRSTDPINRAIANKRVRPVTDTEEEEL